MTRALEVTGLFLRLVGVLGKSLKSLWDNGEGKN